MDLRDYLRVLARRWRAITALALLGTLLGTCATYTATAEYQATATLFVSLQAGADTVAMNQGNSFAQARVRSYAAVAASPQVTGPVVKSLGLDMTPAQLSGRITADVPLDTVLLHVTVTDTQPRRAARIANAVAARFAEVISDLERPSTARQSPVRLSLTAPATPPDAPFSPHTTLNLALGLLAGLTLGIGLSVLLESLDTSVRNSQALSEFLAGIAGPAVLCSIAYDPQAPRNPLATREDLHGRRAEGFRRLRTNLHFANVDRQTKVIAVTSALPDEGKTSVAVNLAAALAESGASVCLVDADLRRPSIARTLGLVRDAGLTTVLIGIAKIHEVLQGTPSFAVLTSGAVPPNPTELLSTEQLRATLRALAEEFDHVVVDTGPVLPVADASVIAPAVDGYLLVVRAQRTTRGQVTDAIRSLERVGTPLLGVVLNRAPLKGEGGTYGYAYEYQPEYTAATPISRLLGRGRGSRVRPNGPLATAPTGPPPRHAAADEATIIAPSLDRQPHPAAAERSSTR
ncbi:capsular exopolysaccharide synthesis family protein [Streptomyces sp. 846.5]|nr:polysaccharide biosynthesis tyrosine autokinase [Streptomyces sp. 846.5]TDT94050.1 capsular exopolysaccharide synthesis family protein [Streptomyces sp. 846.5]